VKRRGGRGKTRTVSAMLRAGERDEGKKHHEDPNGEEGGGNRNRVNQDADQITNTKGGKRRRGYQKTPVEAGRMQNEKGAKKTSPWTSSSNGERGFVTTGKHRRGTERRVLKNFQTAGKKSGANRGTDRGSVRRALSSKMLQL